MKSPIVTFLGLALLFVFGFALGSMKTKIDYLEGKATVPSGQTKGTQDVAPSVTPTAPSGPTIVKATVGPNDPMKGSPNAKLAIVEYSDFQCPFCGRFYKDTLPQILKDYVDTGKAKFVYKNLAFLGQESKDSANAALCAKEQNKFWEYHDKLFTSQAGENQGAFAVDKLKGFAVDLGLNTTQFNSCVEAKKYDAQVQADIADAQTNGLNSTPSFAVGSTPLIGAQPFAQFKTAIDAELAKK